MVINHNISALNTYNKLSTNETSAKNSLEKLSSGLRINKAGDDAAGLAISQKMQAQINGLNQAAQNAQDGISLIQTAEGAMGQIQDIMQRMNDLANQSANGTNDADGAGIDRAAMNDEFQALADEIDRIAASTSFNGKTLIDGSLTTRSASNFTATGVTATATVTDFGDDLRDLSTAGTGTTYTTSLSTGGTSVAMDITLTMVSGSTTVTLTADDVDVAGLGTGTAVVHLTNSNGAAVDITLNSTFTGAGGTGSVAITGKSLQLQIGANEGDQTDITVGDMRTGTSGTNAKLTALGTADISTQEGAAAAIQTVMDAIDGVSSQRAKLGTYQNRLTYTIDNLNIESQNLTAASSQITDVDMAKEMTEYTKNNILTQAAQAMLAQANQLPQGVLSLLKS